MKVKNAKELAKLLNINFDHLQYVWKLFVRNQDQFPQNLFNCSDVHLTPDEKYYLIHLGMDNISDAIMDALKDKEDA